MKVIRPVVAGKSTTPVPQGLTYGTKNQPTQTAPCRACPADTGTARNTPRFRFFRLSNTTTRPVSRTAVRAAVATEERTDAELAAIAAAVPGGEDLAEDR